ncbi:MFS transporter [Paenibacillus sp. 23TSA30-6]|uniref:MFS transporter n=1 Tax=Paenibacillus sp. 23TSA30-6 TaxID=2546104 RepID=UPI001787EE80|nr:MFS transporter [Paenibacillus sp. 23TSA30-6]MBE0339734.1 MFS transporter [Paenibacillus sp. 23TSA30-6]
MKDKIVMPLWAIGIFFTVMNSTMFNVSLPNIIKDLDIASNVGAWIISGYSMVFSLSIVIFSRLSDWIPIRKLLMCGIFLIFASCIVGFFSNQFAFVLLARMLQAAGAGPLQALGLILTSRYGPGERRGNAIALIASGAALAFGIGPVLGGFITDWAGWHALFLVSGVVILLAPLYIKMLPDEKSYPFHTDSRFDVTGTVMTIIFVSSLLLAVSQLSFIFLLIAAISCFIAFRHFRKITDPFIFPYLFKNLNYCKLLVIAFCSLALNMGVVFLIPQVLSNLFHTTASFNGLMIFPGAVFTAILSPLVGSWIDRSDNFRISVIGHIVMLLAVITITMTFHFSPYMLLASYVLFSISYNAIASSLQNEVTNVLPKSQISSGIGLFQLTQFFGGSVATTILGLMISMQHNKPITYAFTINFAFLIAISAISLGILIWYNASNKKRFSNDVSQST